MKKIFLSWNRPKKRRAPTTMYQVFSLLFILLLFKIAQASGHDGLSDELRFIHQEISLLKHENQQQNVEISILKKIMKNSNEEEAGESTRQNSIIDGPNHQGLNYERQRLVVKRPARLLPYQLLFNRNCTTCNDQPVRFYGPPTNCSDLTRLGYTLNGFYMVTPFSNSSSKVSNKTQIETVYCAFKQPDGISNAALVEKRVFQLKSEGTSHQPPGAAPLKVVSNKSSIYFRVHPKSYRHLGVPIIQFPKEIMNSGRGFNVNTGVFVAPRPGIYKFIFKGTLEVDKSIMQKDYSFSINLRFNNDLDVTIVNYNIDNDRFINLVLEDTLKLNRGDKIYLAAVASGPSSKFLESLELNDENISFSGFLIQEFDD